MANPVRTPFLKLDFCHMEVERFSMVNCGLLTALFGVKINTKVSHIAGDSGGGSSCKMVNH